MNFSENRFPLSGQAARGQGFRDHAIAGGRRQIAGNATGFFMD
jgi:hypothetical protein